MIETLIKNFKNIYAKNIKTNQKVNHNPNLIGNI